MSEQCRDCPYEEKLSEIIGMKATLEAMAQDLREIKATVNGNGKPGILTRLYALEQKLASISWLIGPAITGVITAAVMWLVFKKMP